MINPYLLAGALGAGYFGAKRLWERYGSLLKPKLRGTFTVAEFKKKAALLRKQYEGNKDVIDMLNTVETLCKNMRDDEEITIG